MTIIFVVFQNDMPLQGFKTLNSAKSFRDKRAYEYKETHKDDYEPPTGRFWIEHLRYEDK
jgi:hypothetical protein